MTTVTNTTSASSFSTSSVNAEGMLLVVHVSPGGTTCANSQALFCSSQVLLPHNRQGLAIITQRTTSTTITFIIPAPVLGVIHYHQARARALAHF